jgi:hypothetical protein
MKGIEANPDKIKAIIEMEEPKTKKNIQKLNGRVAALNRFILKSKKRACHFSKPCRGKENFSGDRSKAKLSLN